MKGAKARSELAWQLGRKVAQLRRKRNFSQTELADEVGLKGTRPKVISQLERGVSVPRIETLEKIAKALQTTLPSLFDPDEEGVADRRHRAMTRINYILRGRGAADLEAVFEILQRVFKIKRRERPEPPPRKRPTPNVKGAGGGSRRRKKVGP